jgi:hypothetical protein
LYKNINTWRQSAHQQQLQLTDTYWLNKVHVYLILVTAHEFSSHFCRYDYSALTVNYKNINTFRNPTHTLWIWYFVSNIMALSMSDFRFSVFGLFAVIISWLLSSLYLATAVVSTWLLLFQNELMNVRFEVSTVV